VEARGGKILEFLKENRHLDLEIPDIAFNVKKSEKTVETALKKFQQQGLVTARQNEFGRAYWYALPSASATGTIKAVEPVRPPETVAAVADNDEVDLFSLPKAEPPPAPAKRRRSVKKQTVPVKKTGKTAAVKAPEPTQPVEPPPAFIPEPEPVVEAVSDDSKPDAPDEQPAEIAVMEEPEGDEMKLPVKAGGFLPVVAAVTLVGLISLIALVRSGGATKKIEAMGKTIPRDVVLITDFKPVQEQAAKIDALEAKVAVLAAKVDSLSGELAKAEALKTPPKKHVRRPVRRRR
jgi:hypothetical protein